MSKPFSTNEEYLSAILRLGEMVYTNKPSVVALEYFASVCADEENAEVFTPLGALREALSLDSAEAMCVALWMYHDAHPVPPLTTWGLLERF
jgi:hypothetical protein